MSDHQVVSRPEWLEARRTLLREEKAFTRQRDELSAKRRALPWVRIDADYAFSGEDGPCSLLDLFGGLDQLVVYHFMYGPEWEEGCPSCSFWADGYDGLDVHLAHRDTALVAVSRAPLESLLAYRERMGWSFRWVSSLGTSFNEDFGVSNATTYNYEPVEAPMEESPGLSAFIRQGDTVFHTYSCFARGLDPFNAAYQMLDVTARGRHEGDLPWSMAWLRRHDAYDYE
jgi:predicted dithiol-disulfide oxidoreductase (DUF899 family)